MFKKGLYVLLIVVVLMVAHFLFKPVPIAPVLWQAPPNPGYTGPFEPNQRLKGIQTLPIGDNTGPEDIALDNRGRIYAATHGGVIVRLQADGSQPENWVNTGGRPLGIAFDGQGNLIVADAYRGLLSVAPAGQIAVLATEADGIPIRYANNVDVAADGRIFFSDASTKFGAEAWGGTYQASLLDLMEHGGHGRLLVYDPQTGKTGTLLKGLNFANGVAVSHDQQSILINETGNYQVLRYWLEGPAKGRSEPLIGALPGFPDNITRGREGRYWVALVSPRNKLLDGLSDSPFLRKVVQRLPGFMRPKAKPYGHIVAIDDRGEVVADLQDPDAAYPIITSITESDAFLYIGSLVTTALGRLPKSQTGL